MSVYAVISPPSPPEPPPLESTWLGVSRVVTSLYGSMCYMCSLLLLTWNYSLVPAAVFAIILIVYPSQTKRRKTKRNKRSTS